MIDWQEAVRRSGSMAWWGVVEFWTARWLKKLETGIGLGELVEGG